MMAGAKQSRNSQFSKTKMCRFELLGMCTKGTQCPFAHVCVELKPLPDLRCTKLCRELIQFGKCTNKACSYAHSKEELRSSHERAQAMMRNGAFRQQRGGGGGNGRSSAEVPSGKAASVTPGLAGWEGFAGLSASSEAMAGFDAAFRLLAAAQAQGALHGLQGDPSTFDWQALALTMAVAAAGGAGAKAPSRVAAAPQASAMGSKGSPAYVPLRSQKYRAFSVSREAAGGSSGSMSGAPKRPPCGASFFDDDHSFLIGRTSRLPVGKPRSKLVASGERAQKAR